MKTSKNSVVYPESDILRPDLIDEVTIDEDYYYAWETPEKASTPILIMHVKKTDTVFAYTAAFDTWANRTTATYVAWSKRGEILN